jgi:pectate lyase
VTADTDHDGMPDEWEKEHELNPAEATDGNIDSDLDGYANVEEYLNATNPREKIDYRNLGNNVDAMS